jgi:endonuclease G, mitochondrial
MTHASRARTRRLERLHAVGERWLKLINRRADTVRLLAEGGPKRADLPDRVRRYEEREAAKTRAFLRAGVTASFFQERKVGPTLDLDEYPPNDAARIAGIPVGRIVDVGDRGEAREGFATGFIIAPGLAMTNHHVFSDAGECRNCGIQFGYEKQGDAVVEGPVFAFDTSRFFYCDEALDCAIVGVASTSLSGAADLGQFQPLHLSPAVGKILVGQPVSIIQYPNGGPKRYGVRDNELLVPAAPTDRFLQYTTDTLPGSSGSPAFNQDWEVIALHHSGVPEIKDGRIMTIRQTPWGSGMPDSEIHWVANEGARISCICESLITARVDDRYRDQWAELIRTFQEDFTMLPAMQGQVAEAQPVALSADPRRPVSIVVSGTANFYFGQASDAVTTRWTPKDGATDQPAPKPAAPEKTLVFDPDYKGRPGYKEKFLAIEVPHPGIADSWLDEVVKADGKPLVLKYHHYSLVMNRVRRLQMWSAVNVDYTAKKRRKERDEFGTDTWVADPRIPGELQIDDQRLYAPAKMFDRGHIVRREDTAWGDTAQEEIYANSDSFHWTNCTPQHEQFNRAVFQYHGLWGELENHIQRQAKNVGRLMSIFAGPVLDSEKDLEHDFGGGKMLLPRRFWKVLIVVEDPEEETRRLRAFGFVLDQSDAMDEYGVEKFRPDDFDVYQHRLDYIADQAGVTFDDALLEADAMAGEPEEAARIHVTSLNRVRI